MFELLIVLHFQCSIFIELTKFEMRKAGSDPKVKKTLLRNYEQRIRTQPNSIHNYKAGSSKIEEQPNQKDQEPTNQPTNQLNQPTLCSSEALGNYLTDIRKSAPPPLSLEDLNIDKAQKSAKITKKLNFHFNDRIYKNLVQLNTDVANLKSKRDKKPTKSSTTAKRDLEPNIEDFCQEEKEDDLCPDIPINKRIIKPIRRVEDGTLHRLIASFEKL